MVHCHLSDGLEVSIAGSDDVTPSPLSDEREAVTGVRLQSTAEIIVRKIRARMINRESYVVRDTYDVVCCLEFDPQALNEAMAALTKGERATLKYDSGRASLVSCLINSCDYSWPFRPLAALLRLVWGLPHGVVAPCQWAKWPSA